MPVRTSHGPRTGILDVFSYPTGPIRGPCVTRKGAIRRPYGHVRKLTQPELAKIPHGRRIWPYGARTDPLPSPHWLFTGCLPLLNPCGARKLIMHALKLYGPRTGRQNSYRTGPVRAPWMNVRFLFKTAREQPGSSPFGARECDVTEALTEYSAVQYNAGNCTGHARVFYFNAVKRRPIVYIIRMWCWYLSHAPCWFSLLIG